MLEQKIKANAGVAKDFNPEVQNFQIPPAPCPAKVPRPSAAVVRGQSQCTLAPHIELCCIEQGERWGQKWRFIGTECRNTYAHYGLLSA